MRNSLQSWETESLKWIHEVRKRNYERTKHLKVTELPLPTSEEVDRLAAEFGLARVPARSRRKHFT